MISDSAKSCPSCGAPPKKKTSIFTWVVVALFAIIVARCVMFSTSTPGEYPDVKTVEKTAEEKKADAQLNASISVLKNIRAGLKNPKSFELSSFFIFPDGVTCFEYRATNSFNAIVPGRAVFDPEKNKVVLSDGDKSLFVKSWNERCTRHGGKEMAGGLKHLSVF